jgi:hypothetical protein
MDRGLLFPFGMSLRDGTRLTLERVLRPVRIGYRVDPRSPEQIRCAVETATMHWGGILHALIPVLRSRPRWWDPGRQVLPWVQSASAVDIARSYEEAFDCDFVVDARADDDDHDYRTVSLKQLRAASRWAATEAGLSVLPIYARLWRDEFRFESRRRVHVVVPQPQSDELGLFVDVCFGRFFSERADIEETYRKTFDAAELIISPETLLDGFPVTAGERLLGPLEVGQYGVSVARFGPRGDPVRDGTVVVVDPNDAVDLFDLWNVRASGAQVVAIPTTWAEALAKPLAERLVQGLPPGSGRRVEIYAGRRGTSEAAQALIDALSEKHLSVWRAPPLVASPFPGHLNAALAEADRDEVDVVASRGLVEIPLLVPRIPDGGFTGVDACINTLTMRAWALPRDGSVAAFIPSRLGTVSALLGPTAPAHVRASKRGLEFSASFRNEKVTIRQPSGRQVIAAILRLEGFDAQASDAGIVAERLIAQMGSLAGTSLLRHRELLKLLNKAAVSGVEMEPNRDDADLRVRVSFIKRGQLMGALGRVFGSRHVDSVLKQLVERNVLRVGLTLRCDACGYMNWLELDAVRRSLRCERCLTDYHFPEASPPDIGSWAYRPTGACSVENYARGSYTVAQVLRVLEPIAEPMVWCTGTQLEKALEVDLAAVRKRREDLPRLIFGEAKTLGPFKATDFHRASRIIRRFKDSTFVFATLRDGLSRDEQRAIRALARPRARRASNLPYHPRFLVLTALELSSVGRLPECWREAGGRTAELAAASEHYVRDEVDVWADITMQLHLGLGPHTDWWNREMKRITRGQAGR